MMAEINELKRRVRALQRKLARELAELRLGRICDDLCERWFAAWSDHKPLPGIRPFIKRVMDAGYRLLPWARPTTTWNVALAKMTLPTLKCCSRPSFPEREHPACGMPGRPSNIQLCGFTRQQRTRMPRTASGCTMVNGETTMTTPINTFQDILDALERDPALRDALRRHILSEELLQLPAAFAAFVEAQRDFNERVDAFIEEQTKWNQEQTRWNANTEARMGRLEGDMSNLKGDNARSRTIQDASGIAADMGLEYVRTLTNEDLLRMAGNSLTKDTARSFRNADLVIEATDTHDTHYIAMEISFTADRREVDPGAAECQPHQPVHRQDGPARSGQRQKRPRHPSRPGRGNSVLAPSGRPDSGGQLDTKEHFIPERRAAWPGQRSRSHRS